MRVSTRSKIHRHCGREQPRAPGNPCRLAPAFEEELYPNLTVARRGAAPGASFLLLIEIRGIRQLVPDTHSLSVQTCTVHPEVVGSECSVVGFFLEIRHY